MGLNINKFFNKIVKKITGRENHFLHDVLTMQDIQPQNPVPPTKKGNIILSDYQIGNIKEREQAREFVNENKTLIDTILQERLVEKREEIEGFRRLTNIIMRKKPILAGMLHRSNIDLERSDMSKRRLSYIGTRDMAKKYENLKRQEIKNADELINFINITIRNRENGNLGEDT